MRIDSKRVLAVIPARGGSKGVTRKNLRSVGGRPLIEWTISAALNASYIDRIILSSDDSEIIQVAQAAGCEAPFIRSPDLAEDKTPTINVVLDALERCPGYTWVILLQPTSPLRNAQDIDAAMAQCFQQNAPACVSVCLAQESPYWMYTLEDGHIKPLLAAANMVTRRQDLPLVYSLNGAIYIARVDWLQTHRSFIHPQTIAYEMPIERSIDIDTEADLYQLQMTLKK